MCRSITVNHQFWRSRESGRGDRHRNVQLRAIVGSSNGLWPWPWIRSRSCQHKQYVYDYPHPEPRDCSIAHYRNMAIWISSNIDIERSLNSRDSFPRWKFKNRAPTSSSSGPILWPPTISFELHTKMAEEIDLEKCNFRNFGSSVTLTLTLDRVEVYPHTKLDGNQKKSFCGRTDGRTGTPEFHLL